MSGVAISKGHLSDEFQKVSAHVGSENSSSPPPKPAPFSLRLNAEERAYLDEQAGNQPLGAYIRSELLSDRMQKRRRQRKPKIDEQQLASALSVLGESRLASNLNQIAHHANTGTLDVSIDLERELQEAYEAVIVMRDALLTSLGFKETT